jgi:hypothetical protein
LVVVVPVRATVVVPSAATRVKSAAKPVPSIEPTDPTAPMPGARVICGLTEIVALADAPPALIWTV